MDKKISICIAGYNMAHLLEDTINSCLSQDYMNKEIVFYDDCSTDDTFKKIQALRHIFPQIKYYRGEKNLGVGEAFNMAIRNATGDYIVLMCADDVFTNEKVLHDINFFFNAMPALGHISRYYYQFVDGYIGPVRAWRSNSPITLANNPSGLAFRREALESQMGYLKCSNHMFIETSALVRKVLDSGWGYFILKYDAIAARVHRSTSTQKSYCLKRRVSSPIKDWVEIGGTEMLTDYASLIQIKNGFTTKALLEEIFLFIKLQPWNIVMPNFWFFVLVSLLTPRFILRELPAFYRHRIGRILTKEIKRQCFPW